MIRFDLNMEHDEVYGKFVLTVCICSRWLDTVFKKNGNLRFRSVFLENYYLFEDKEYFCYVKQHLKSSNSFTKVAQLPLLWQQ